MGRSSKLIGYLAAALLLTGPAQAAPGGGGGGGGAGGAGAGGAGVGGAGVGAAGLGALGGGGVRAGIGGGAAAPRAGIAGTPGTVGTRGYGARGAPLAPVARPGLAGRGNGAVHERFRGPYARDVSRFRRFGFRGRRFGFPFTFSDYGYGGGDGYGVAPNGPALADAPYDAPYTDEPPDLPEPPRPCVRPLIIKIDRGARHKVTTRVIYGGPPACVRGY